MEPEPFRPLDGIRVVDLSRILAGPWATQILADLGADVIKVERPGAGDDTRRWGPPYAAAGPGETGEAAYFLGANRGKRSLAVDLKSPRGAALVRDLVVASDVLIENFKAGDLKRYGLDAESLRARHPGLIYCSVTGFGQGGPRAAKAGYDLMIQGMAGLMSITGQPEGAPGGEPLKVGVAVVDILTGLYAAIGILAALCDRAETGRGCHIDLALFDVCAASLANQAMNYLIGGTAPGRLGNLHPNIAPYQTYRTADGHIIIAVGNDSQFARLCEAMGLAELAADPDFATNSARVVHRPALNEILDPKFLTRSRADWLALLEPLGVPCGPINTIDEVFADPHAVARGLVRPATHAALGEAPVVANPLHFDGVSATSGTAAPLLGQHSAEVLSQVLGLNAEQIAALQAEGVIAGRPCATTEPGGS